MEIASFIIGIIALGVGMMAIPTIFQMFFGRPKLLFDTDEFTGTEGTVLVLRILNDPVKNSVLLWMCVERDSADIFAVIDVQEQGTGKVLVRTIPGMLQEIPTQTFGRSARVIPGFSVGLMAFCSKDGAAGIVDARKKPEEAAIPLPEGHYVARIVITRGQHTYDVVKAFKIGKQDHEAIWYGDLNVSKR